MSKLFKNNSIAHGVLITLISTVIVGGFMWYKSISSDMELLKYKVDENIESYATLNIKIDKLIERIDTKNNGLSQKLDKLNDENIHQHQIMNNKIDSLRFQMFKFKVLLKKYEITNFYPISQDTLLVNNLKIN